MRRNVLFVLATIAGAAFAAPHIAHVAALARESPEDAPSADLATVLASNRGDVLFAIDSILIVAFVFDMVVKPFS